MEGSFVFCAFMHFAIFSIYPVPRGHLMAFSVHKDQFNVIYNFVAISAYYWQIELTFACLYGKSKIDVQNNGVSNKIWHAWA